MSSRGMADIGKKGGDVYGPLCGYWCSYARNGKRKIFTHEMRSHEIVRIPDEDAEPVMTGSLNIHHSRFATYQRNDQRIIPEGQLSKLGPKC
jgi:hypothetical protein